MGRGKEVNQHECRPSEDAPGVEGAVARGGGPKPAGKAPCDTRGFLTARELLLECHSRESIS